MIRRKLRTFARLVRNLDLLPTLRAEVAELRQGQQQAEAQAASRAASLAESLARQQPVAPPPAGDLPRGRETLLTLGSGQLGAFVPLDHPQVLQPRPPAYRFEAVLRRLRQDQFATDDFLAALAPMLAEPAFAAIPAMQASENSPHWDNGYFTGDDARLLMAYVARFRPARILEIGSGNSTRFARHAIQHFATGTRITSIDPQPRASIRAICDQVVEASVLEVDLALFDQLEPGDLLFHDGSHLVLNGADTVCLFLEILPRLRPGVVVQIHDITLPRDYPAAFDGRGYAEQYMLAACLLAGDQWQVLAPVAQLAEEGRLPQGGVSFWMRRA
ncbi:class I SAM-dependent methyltransferase [Falsiroseomonas selenitidurans]|uniref:Class I SAM-dependent methyltransferase n=1 Tax=Falsiroseomonas selenitidurans TaxID=2716335 RepID=A0ABX1DZ94_9PROT|nr:class I SAM-dependent methyltransferase [Falsiroseomonas selenitidurans]NKC30229.1 class I SAM-dependent methyltransferase [Falsiroseomonas selenitidurans]